MKLINKYKYTNYLKKHVYIQIIRFESILVMRQIYGLIINPNKTLKKKNTNKSYNNVFIIKLKYANVLLPVLNYKFK